MQQSLPLPVRFSSVRLGNKQVRYIYLRHPDSFYVTARTQENDIPLFLGADVLCGSTVLTKNHGRIHARFAKENLATKVKLKGVQVEGINHSSQLWFYNVQGLFKVTFEYLQEEAQRDCLLHLKDLWLETIECCQLPQDMCLSYCNDNMIDLSSQSDLPNLAIDASQVLADVQQDHQQVTYVRTNVQEITTPEESLVELALPLVQQEEIVVESDPGKILEFTFPKEPTSSSGYGSVVFLDGLIAPQMSDVDVQVSPQIENFLQNATVIGETMNLGQVCSHVTSFLQKQQDNISESEGAFLKKLQTLFRFFRAEYVDNNPDDASFPLEVIEQYVNLLSDKTTNKYNHDTFNVPYRANLALCVICEWLGKELHGFSEEITEKVEMFKLRHIDSINSLPSAQTLVDSLFPACMKILMVNWMGQQGLGYVDETDHGSDHDYSPPSKKHAPSDSYKQPGNTFPFVQLILEFANNVLISGVAHVLYSRLLHDGSC